MNQTRQETPLRQNPARLEWTEPEIKMLEIGDTKFTDGYGGDVQYEPSYYDVSAS